MKVNWDAVPNGYRYLDNTVLQNRLNDLLVVPWVDELGRSVAIAERTALKMTTGLTTSEVADLSRVYHEIMQREDNLPILHWHTQTREKEEEKAARWILRLLSLLRELGEFGVPPFHERLVADELQPTWQNLPEELRYLRDAVERYCTDLPQDGPIAQGMHFLRKSVRMLAGERRKLRELGQRIEQDEQAIRNWYQTVRKTPEAGKFLDLENILVSAEILRDDLTFRIRST